MVRPRIVVAEGAIGLNKPNRHCNFTSQSRGSVRFGEKAPHPSSRIGRQEPNAGCGANKVRGWEGTRTNGQCPIGAAGNYVGESAGKNRPDRAGASWISTASDARQGDT